MANEIRINTDSLRNYAGQLANIQNQIYALNAEIRSFRYHTGKLYNVNVYGYEGTINAAKAYCVDTANEFDSIERYLQGCNPEKYEGNTGWLSSVVVDEIAFDYTNTLNAVRDVISQVGNGFKNVKKEKNHTRDLTKDLVEEIPFIGGGLKVVHSICDTSWHEKNTTATKVGAFVSDMLGVTGDTLSLIKDSGEIVDKHIELLKKGTEKIMNRPLLVNEYELDVAGKTPEEVLSEAIKLIDTAETVSEYDYKMPPKEWFYSWVFANGLR